MESFVIRGGDPLYGSVRLGGAKNASFKLMIASLLCPGETRLLNLSHISDVNLVGEIIETLGGKVTRRGERTLFIDSTKLHSHLIDEKYGPQSRSAPMFVPVLLHRFKQAVVPNPGGDKIGSRPLDRHWQGLMSMGAKIQEQNGQIIASCTELVGTDYRFSKNTHTGTEVMIMAAVLARGKTTLHNAALEPEIDDLIEFLNQMGARIRRRLNRIIEIDGVRRLKPAIYRIMPDRNEAVSYACAAIATKGDIIVENAKSKHLAAFLEKLEEMGGGYEVGNYGIRFFWRGELRATDIITEPHPGFMTDWQPLWAVLLTQAHGTSVIHETIYPERFQYIEHLIQMGVQAQPFKPKVKDPERFYNFDHDKESLGRMHAVKITGPTHLEAGEFSIKDLRHGATMVIAAIVADKISKIHQVEHIDRGYENLDQRLRSMGAHITRVKS